MIAIVGDIHFSHSPPASRKSSYPDEVIAKLEEIIEFSHKCDAVIQVGDIFHRRGAKATFQDLYTMMEVFKKFPCPVYAIWGNHDCPAGTPENTPFGVMLESGVIKLMENGKVYDVGHPYKNPLVIASGFSWAHDIDQDIENFKIPVEIPDSKGMFGEAIYIHITHGTVYPTSPWKDAKYVPTKFLQGFYNNERRWLFNGHLHAPFRQGNMVGTGSIVRVARSETHRPRFYTIDYSGKMTERYISACESHEDVFLPTMGTMVLDEEDHRLQDAVRRFRENSDTKQRPLWEAFWELVEEFDLTEEQIQKVKGYLEDDRDE